MALFSLPKIAKKVWLVMLFVVAGVGLFFIFVYNPLDPRARALRAEKKMIRELEEKYRNDTYGGATPEETLQLFIDALKKGDTNLAAKYFILDDQEKWREDLSKINERNLLGEMVKDLNKAKRGNDISDKSSRFIVVNDSDEVITVINVVQNVNGKWKILDF